MFVVCSRWIFFPHFYALKYWMSMAVKMEYCSICQLRKIQKKKKKLERSKTEAKFRIGTDQIFEVNRWGWQTRHAWLPAKELKLNHTYTLKRKKTLTEECIV